MGELVETVQILLKESMPTSVENSPIVKSLRTMDGRPKGSVCHRETLRLPIIHWIRRIHSSSESRNISRGQQQSSILLPVLREWYHRLSNKGISAGDVTTMQDALQSVQDEIQV